MSKEIVIGGGILVGAVLLGSVVLGSWYSVDQGERAVVLRNGALTNVAEPGLGFKLPFVDEVKKISVQSRARIYDNLPTYSSDQQTAVLRVSVNYQLPADQVANIYSEYGGEEGLVVRLLDTQVRELVRIVFGQYTAARAIQQRGQLSNDIQTAIMDNVKGPIIITNVQLENIDFSDAYENSIEQRMLAEVEVQRTRQNAEREKVSAEIAVIQAKAQAEASLAQANANAEASLVQAKASAEAIKLQGEAQAGAIKARAAALGQNPGLVALTTAERWNGMLPSMMVPGDAVPMIEMPQPRAK